MTAERHWLAFTNPTVYFVETGSVAHVMEPVWRGAFGKAAEMLAMCGSASIFNDEPALLKRSGVDGRAKPWCARCTGVITDMVTTNVEIIKETAAKWSRLLEPTGAGR